MKYRHLALASLLGFTLSACNSNEASDDVWSQYQAEAENTQKLIKEGNLTQIERSASGLVTLSKQILPLVTAKQAKCDAYLDAALSAADNMVALSLEAIERDYHADGKLPKVEAAECYHAKDLLVHPATVVVLTKGQDNPTLRAQMQDEIAEVIEHFAQVKASAGQ